MSRIISLLSLAGILLVPLQAGAGESPSGWGLPVALSDDNSSVRFEVDSTWHVVHGVTAGIRGRVWLADPADPSTVRAEVDLPVSAFDTGSSSRDERLREIMAAQEFPDVSFAADRAGGLCTPEGVVRYGECQEKIFGTLLIRGVRRSIELPVKISHDEGGFRLNGSVTIDWPDYGVEDPSILIARVDRHVRIDFEVLLAAPAARAAGIKAQSR